MKKVKYIGAAIIVVAVGILTYFYVNKINGEGIIIITAVGDSDEFSNNTGVDNIGVHQIYDYESDEEYSNRQSFVDLSMEQGTDAMIGYTYNEDTNQYEVVRLEYESGTFIQDEILRTLEEGLTIEYPHVSKDFKLYYTQTRGEISSLVEYDLQKQEEKELIDSYIGPFGMSGHHIYYTYYTSSQTDVPMIYTFNLEDDTSEVWKEDAIFSDISSNGRYMTYYRDNNVYMYDMQEDKETQLSLNNDQHVIKVLASYSGEFLLLTTRKDGSQLYDTHIVDVKTKKEKSLLKQYEGSFFPRNMLWLE